MADIIVDAEIKADVGQLEQSLQQAESSVSKLSQGFGIATGAIATAQGAMKLLGSDSDKVEKAILQVQAAMSLNQGVQSLLAQRKAIVSIISFLGKWTGATKLLTIGQAAFNAVMAANPVGAIVAGVTALIAAGTTLISVFKSSKDEVVEIDNRLEDVNHTMGEINKKQIAQQPKLEANKRIIEDTNALEQDRLDALKENFDIQKKLDDESLVALREKLALAKEESRQKQSSLDFEKQEGASAETIKARQDALNTAKKNQQDIEAEILKLHNKQNEAIRIFGQEQKKISSQFFKEMFEQAKKRNEANKVAYAARLEQEKAFNKQIALLQDEENLAAIEDEKEREAERLRIQFENQKEEINASKSGRTVKNNLIKELEEKLNRDLADIRKTQEDEEIAALEEREKFMRNLINENADALIEDETEREVKRLEREKAARLEELKDHEDYLLIKEQLDINYDNQISQLRDKRIDDDKAANKELVHASLSASSSLLKDASEFAGENKALAVGAAIIDTYVAANKALAGGSPPTNFIAMAGVLAAGFKSVQAIFNTDAGDGGGGSAPTMETTPAPQMMSGNFELGQGIAPEPTKAFVVTDEMTNSQNQLANIRRRSTI